MSFPDSASAVAAARRMLGERLASEQVKTVLVTPDGVFLKFVDTSPNSNDGTASVYVTPGPCVAFLGW